MSATSLQVITVDFANPEWGQSSNQFQRVNASVSFSYVTPSNLQTLSTNNAQGGEDITGLLYVPTLPSDDPCINASAQYVPKNVTRQDNLPNTDYDLIALAPWISPDCTLKYLASARLAPVRAFLFFLPDNSTAQPPAADSNTWALGDGQAWTQENPFPVYAVPGNTGNILMNASAQYSGNMTDAPNGHLLTESYDSRDYVRLYVDVSTGGASSLPSLWVFLLVVLGILLGIIGLTSFTMHLLQRRRRQTLRRRVASGEVDLEALGIKRLTVPQEILDRMPLYTYGSGAPVAPQTRSREHPSTATTAVSAAAADKLSTPSSSRPSSPNPAVRPQPAIRSTSYHPSPLSQPTCPICLDDFVPASADPPPSTASPSSTAATDPAPTNGTIVRELPCHHIFHPECVDSFLRDSSSLCPMCKKTALPTGYCPRVVTNAMVRRERMVRRLRPTAVEEEGEIVGSRWGARVRSWGAARSVGGLGTGAEAARTGGGRYWSGPAGAATRNSIPSTAPASEEMSEMIPPSTSVARGSRIYSLSRNGRRASTMPVSSADHSQPGARVQPPDTVGRREWARQRAIAMLGRDRAPVDPDAEEAASTPRWRKVVRGMFPAGGGGGGGEGGAS